MDIAVDCRKGIENADADTFGDEGESGVDKMDVDRRFARLAPALIGLIDQKTVRRGCAKRNQLLVAKIRCCRRWGVFGCL